MKKIQLNQGQFALIDDDDFEKITGFGKWSLIANGYAGRTIKPGKQPGLKVNKTIWMHRIIMDAPKGMFVDHIDGNKLNNQKSNLRVCSRAQNGQNRGAPKSNTSGFKGVHWFPACNKWRSRIVVNKKAISLGLFDCKIEAAKAYNIAALEYHGEFANVNEI